MCSAGAEDGNAERNTEEVVTLLNSTSLISNDRVVADTGLIDSSDADIKVIGMKLLCLVMLSSCFHR